MRHTLKCWPESFEAIWGGLKSYEIRKTDHYYSVGDSLQVFDRADWSTQKASNG